MQRFNPDPASSLSPARLTRSIGTQTGPSSAPRTRQTQTEPHLCLSCHTAQLIELLRPGRMGRVPARPGDFAGAALFPIREDDEAGPPAGAPQSLAGRTAE